MLIQKHFYTQIAGETQVRYLLLSHLTDQTPPLLKFFNKSISSKDNVTTVHIVIMCLCAYLGGYHFIYDLKT